MEGHMRKTLWPKETQEVAADRKIRGNKNGKDQSKRKLVDEICCKNEDIIHNIGHIEQQQHDLLIRKRKCILELAENFEKLRELGEYKEPLYTIDKFIYELAQEHDLSIAQNWIHDILPEKYKQPMLYLPLYNAHELNELLVPSTLPSFPSPMSPLNVTTAIKEVEVEDYKRVGAMRGDPYQVRKIDYEG